jgi:hypothetical protein
MFDRTQDHERLSSDEKTKSKKTDDATRGKPPPHRRRAMRNTIYIKRSHVTTKLFFNYSSPNKRLSVTDDKALSVHLDFRTKGVDMNATQPIHRFTPALVSRARTLLA